MPRTITARQIGTNAYREPHRELSTTDLASVVVGTIGSATAGAGAGKISFNGWNRVPNNA
jgi:hypothetical protein